ncbi:MAG: hypothetical protein KDK70_38185 [Myxococcales bacterium]|nr:hypothetical protein [Myxococcales bacterium]
MSVTSLAAQAQRSSGYSVDVWIDMKIEPMEKLWQGVGGHSNFFFSEHDARESTGAYAGTKPYRFAETLWRLAQVEPNPTLGYRQEIAEFVVDIPVLAAVGCCLANMALGSGSVFQYYIPDWENSLFRTGRTYRFGSKGY